MATNDKLNALGLAAAQARAGATSAPDIAANGLRSSSSSIVEALRGFGAQPSSTEVKGLYFNGQTVHLDGYRFVRCRFDNCTMVVSTLDFEFVECIIDPSTTVHYSNRLVKLLKLFLGRFGWASKYFDSEWLPSAGSNGSVTISDKAV